MCNIKILTVASKEINNSALYKWELSAKYYGYEYIILGREEIWKGWPFRTKKYLEHLLKEREKEDEIFCLVDCLDGFFTATVEEMYDKFISSRKHLIIGVESNLFYKDSNKYPLSKLHNFFDNLKSRYKYPNGGFIIGRRNKIIKLLTLNKNSIDDQAGYINLMYENKINISRDHTTLFCGNIPLLNDRDESIYWGFNGHRFYNIETNNFPCFLHFSGGNLNVMNIFWDKLSLDYKKYETINTHFTSSSSPNSSKSLNGQNKSEDYNNFLVYICLVIFILFLSVLGEYLFITGNNTKSN